MILVAMEKPPYKTENEKTRVNITISKRIDIFIKSYNLMY